MTSGSWASFRRNYPPTQAEVIEWRHTTHIIIINKQSANDFKGMVKIPFLFASSNTVHIMNGFEVQYCQHSTVTVFDNLLFLFDQSYVISDKIDS